MELLGYTLTPLHMGIVALAVIIVIWFLLRNRSPEAFDDQSKGDLVLFYAPWCPHCKHLMPVWDQLEQRYNKSSNLTVRKVDCQAHPEEAKKHQIDGYPTIILFKQGRPMIYTGADRSLETIEKWVSSV